MDFPLISKPFPHRENPDGTFDSICPVCFLTVARRREEMQLREIELRHVCELEYQGFDSTGINLSMSRDSQK
jgi:hypothetical protein